MTQFRNKPKVWHKCVDEIFNIWDSTMEQLQVFLQEINVIERNIQFRLEIEQNGKLHFLGIELIKDNINIETKIY